jgi:hypothetical protein
MTAVTESYEKVGLLMPTSRVGLKRGRTCGYLFSSMVISLKGRSLRLSGRCTSASNAMPGPAFVYFFLIFAS